MNAKINNPEQLCSVKRLQYLTGRAKGTEILLVQNGRLCFELIVDKGLDIGALSHCGVNISFLSASGINPSEREFDAAFNGGMLYTCGLDTIGGRALPIHGRYHNIPAEIVKAEANEYGVEIVGIVRMCSLFGEKLMLRRTVKTAVGSDTVTVSDEITNFSHTDADYCLLYHINLGYPMLDDGVSLTAPILTTAARTQYAATKINDCLIMENPVDGGEETVFYHTVSRGEVTVVNSKLGKKFSVSYDSSVLPHLIEWKSMVSGAYALGIEPATTTLDDDFKKSPIAAGETVKTGVTLSFSDLNNS